MDISFSFNLSGLHRRFLDDLSAHDSRSPDEPRIFQLDRRDPDFHQRRQAIDDLMSAGVVAGSMDAVGGVSLVLTSRGRLFVRSDARFNIRAGTSKAGSGGTGQSSGARRASTQRTQETPQRPTVFVPPGPARSKPAPQLQKLALVGLECDIDVTAQYNPKEVQIEKSLSWNSGANSKDDRPQLEFGAVQARTLSMELMFDTYESEEDVQQHVSKLLKLASVIDPNNKNHTERDRRPTLVQVQWGKPDLPIFRGVIQSISTKLTMFLPSGTPVRATCNVKMMEATYNINWKGAKKKENKKPPGSPTSW
jgi:hypothetical protein